MGPHGAAADAIKEFKKKFNDKTKNKWEDRNKFVPKTGKYTLLEMGDDDDEEDARVMQKVRCKNISIPLANLSKKCTSAGDKYK